MRPEDQQPTAKKTMTQDKFPSPANALSTTDWMSLSLPAAVAARNSIDPRVIEKSNYDLVDNVVALINHECEIIFFEAQLAADVFMHGIQNKLNSGSEENKKTFIRPRIRLTAYNTIDILWVRLVPGRVPLKTPIPKGKKVFYKIVNGKKLPFQARSERISKGKSEKYTRSLFKNEPEWVQDLIEICENKFVYLRKKSETLSEIRRSAYKLNYATKKLYDEIIGLSEDRYLSTSPEEYRLNPMKKNNDLKTEND